MAELKAVVATLQDKKKEEETKERMAELRAVRGCHPAGREGDGQERE